MRFSLTYNAGLNVNQAAPTLLHLLNGHCDAMGNLIIQKAQRLLANEFRGNLPHGLIRHRVLIIELRAVRQVFKDQLCQQIRILVLQCRKRHDFRKIADIFVGRDKGENFILVLYRINLVDYQNDRGLYILDLLRYMTLARADEGGRLHQPEYHVHFLQSVLSHVHHIFAQLILGLMNAGCV